MKQRIIKNKYSRAKILRKLPRFPRIFEIPYLGNEILFKKSFYRISALYMGNQHVKFRGIHIRRFRDMLFRNIRIVNRNCRFVANRINFGAKKRRKKRRDRFRVRFLENGCKWLFKNDTFLFQIFPRNAQRPFPAPQDERFRIQPIFPLYFRKFVLPISREQNLISKIGLCDFSSFITL